MRNEKGKAAVELAKLISDKKHVREVFLDFMSREPTAHLSERHGGAVGAAETATGEKIDKIKRRDLFIAACTLGSFVTGTAGLIANLGAVKGYFGDNTSPGGWAVSPDVARKVLTLGYSDPALAQVAKTSKGDEALLNSIRFHRSFDLWSLRGNITELKRGLENTNDVDGRYALLLRLLIDYSALGNGDGCAETLSQLAEEDIDEAFNGTAVNTRILDFASTVALNTLSGEELKRIQSPKLQGLFAIYDRGNYPQDAAVFDLVEAHGIGVFSVIQAQHLRKMHNAHSSRRDQVREEWVQSIVDCVGYSSERYPDKARAIVEDAIYSLTRVAFNAALNDNIEHARDILSLSMGNDARLDQYGAADIKASIVEGFLPLNSQWARALDISIALKQGRQDEARQKLQLLTSKRRATTNVAIEKAVSELVRIAELPSLVPENIAEAPTIEMNTAYLDAISLT